MFIIVFSLNFLAANELTNLIVQAAKLNQLITFKGILASKFGSKDVLLWKRGSDETDGDPIS